MLIRKIERFLRKTHMPPSLFGRCAVGDPRLVRDLRNGREPREATVARVKAFMDSYLEATHAL